MKFELPQIPEAEQTPVVRGLLVLVEKLIEHTQKQQEEMDVLKDDIKVLKGEKKRPKFKASKLDESTNEEIQETVSSTQGNDNKKNHVSVITKRGLLFIESAQLSQRIFQKALVSKVIRTLSFKNW
jgi:hypothetical protein